MAQPRGWQPWGWGVPVPRQTLLRLLRTGTHCRLSGEKDSVSSCEANVSHHGNWVWKHHQNMSNEGN